MRTPATVLSMLICSLVVLGPAVRPAFASDRDDRLSAAAVEHFARLALDCADQEYPNKIGHTMQSDADLAPPRVLHPAFFGCFDWHSSVHGHWLLARLARLHPEASFAAEARRVLDDHLTPERITAELVYFKAPDRASYERPYGLAWLLQLATELREWGVDGNSTDARRWSAALEPLTRETVRRLMDWLPKLRYPIRTGEHSQTSFALGLVLDYARGSDDRRLADLVERKAREFHRDDRRCNLDFEPSGQDFLSPCLATADLMRRVMQPGEFAHWLHAFLPLIPDEAGTGWLPVAEVTDRSDGKLAHLDGVNLSRAWMLEGIAAGLPADDPRLAAIRGAAVEHRRVGLAAVDGEHYAGGHWLASFAVYLVTGTGL